MARSVRRSVRRRMRLVRHIVAYAVVTSALVVIDVAQGPGWWFYVVAVPWGALLLLHWTRMLTRRRGPLERYLTERGLPS